MVEPKFFILNEVGFMVTKGTYLGPNDPRALTNNQKMK